MKDFVFIGGIGSSLSEVARKKREKGKRKDKDAMRKIQKRKAAKTLLRYKRMD